MKSAAVLAAAWPVSRILRRQSAAARHLVWVAASAAILALPVLSISLPAWRIADPPVSPPANVGVLFRIVATGKTAAADVVQAVQVEGAAAAGSSASNWWAGWRMGLLIVWALGAGVVILQLLAAYARLARVRRRARRLPEDPTAGGMAQAMGIREPVEILEGAAGSMPMTFGMWRPVVFLPADAAAWEDSRRHMVLLHELAHVHRGDTASHLLARVALALNWWNPLAWMAWRECVCESERAADDLVLETGARASEYARHLLEVARSMQTSPMTVWAAVAMAQKSQLEGRLVAILDGRARRSAAGRRTTVAGAIAAVMLAAPFAAIRGQDPVPVPPDVDATIRAALAQKNHEILEQAALGFEARSQFELARKLLNSALAIRAQVAGEQSAAYAAGLVKLGDLEQMRHHYAEAKAFYTKAVSLGDRREVAPALLYLGMQELNRDRAAAEDYLQRAVAVDAQGSSAAAANRWLAEMRSRQGNAEAETYYQRALAVERPGSAEEAYTLLLYARFLRGQGRDSESQSVDARAREIMQAVNAEAGKAANEWVRAHAGASDAAPAVGGPVYRVGGAVTPPSLLQKVEPEYTEEARAAKFQGTVLLYTEISPEGRATNIKVSRSLGLGLDVKAIEAVRQWIFKPGTKDGQPVTVAATIEVNFRLL